MADKIGRVFIEVDADIQKMNAKFGEAINKIMDADGKFADVGKRMAQTVERALNPTEALANKIIALGKAGVSGADTWRYLGDRIERAMEIARRNGKTIDPIVQQLYEQAKAAGLATTATQRWGAQWTSLSRLLGAAGIGVGIYQITRGIADFVKESVQMGVAAVESENLFSVSMGKMANAAREWSQSLGKSLGLNEYELRKNVATFNVMFTAMGMGADKAFEMAKGLTQLAYDFASFYNLRPDEAFEKLRSGISGEIEPLRRLGIVVDEASTKTYAYSTGIAKFGDDLTQQQKVLARYGLILQQTSAAQGDLARTIDSPANAMRVFASRVDMLQTSLGFAFLPALIAVTGALNNLAASTQIGNSGLQWLAKSIAAPIMGFYTLGRAIANVKLTLAEWHMAIAITDKAHRDAGEEMRNAAASVLEYDEKIRKLEKNVESLGKFEYGAVKATQAMETADLNASKEAEKAAKKREEILKALDIQYKSVGDSATQAANVSAAAWRELDLIIDNFKTEWKDLGTAIDDTAVSLYEFNQLKPREPWPDPEAAGRTFKDMMEIPGGIQKTTDNLIMDQSKSAKKVAEIWRNQVSTIVTDWSRGIADILIEGGDFGRKLTDIFKETAKSILRYLIEQLFNPLKKWLSSILNDLLGFGKTAAAGTASAGLFPAAGGYAGVGAAAAGGGGILAYTGMKTPGAKGWLETMGGAAATGAGIGTMILPGVGTVVGAFIGLYVGTLMKAIQQWLGKSAETAGAIEAGRDFGIKISEQTFKGFYQSMGLSESQAYGIRKDLMTSPAFISQIAVPAAESQGRLDALLKSLEKVTVDTRIAASGYLNFRAAVEQGIKTGNWEPFNKQWSEAFAKSQALTAIMPDFASKLAAVASAASDAADAATGLSSGMQGLLDAITSTQDAADDMYGTFLKTGEILPQLAEEIQKYGGNLAVFQRYASLGGLRENLTAIGNLISGLNDILPDLDPIQKLLSGGGIDWTGLQAMNIDPSKLIPMADLITFETKWEDSVKQFQDTGKLLSGSVLQQALWKFGGEQGTTALANYSAGFNTITPGLLDMTKSAMDVAYKTERATAMDYLKGVQSTMESEIEAATDAIVAELKNILAAIQAGNAATAPLATGEPTAQTVTAQGGLYVDMRGATVFGYDDFQARVNQAIKSEYYRGGMAYAIP